MCEDRYAQWEAEQDFRDNHYDTEQEDPWQEYARMEREEWTQEYYDTMLERSGMDV